MPLGSFLAASSDVSAEKARYFNTDLNFLEAHPPHMRAAHLSPTPLHHTRVKRNADVVLRERPERCGIILLPRQRILARMRLYHALVKLATLLLFAGPSEVAACGHTSPLVGFSSILTATQNTASHSL